MNANTERDSRFFYKLSGFDKYWLYEDMPEWLENYYKGDSG